MKSTYLALLKYTDKGMQGLSQSPERATAWKQQVEATGLRVVVQLWTAGPYDGVLLLEGPSEEKVLAALAGLSRQGNVRTESLRAFDAAEFAAIARG
jgi:uncharacterized protein with GYD domain